MRRPRLSAPGAPPSGSEEPARPPRDRTAAETIARGAPAIQPLPGSRRNPRIEIGSRFWWSVVLVGCAGPQHALEPAGPGAARIAELWWVMFWIAALTTVAVLILLLVAVVRGRRGVGGLERDGNPARAMVWGGGVAFPLVVIFVLVVLTVRVGAEVYVPARAGPDALTIEVIGHKFWWEVRYPQHGVSTANEIYLPAGEPVRVQVSAPDVIHSFWVPRLHGKIDMIPGRVNTLWLQADEPGLYRGQCAEYCGAGHALMAFWVEAMEPEAFSAWLRHRRTPAPEPDDPLVRLGREVYFEASCHHCHATRGAPLPPELGTVGPDLTDFAARRTIAAGVRPNNRGTLAAWLADPEAMKPGARMPPTHLESVRFQALLTYLESLR